MRRFFVSQQGSVAITAVFLSFSVLAICALGLASWMSQTNKTLNQSLTKSGAKLVSNSIQGYLNNDDAWTQTVQHNASLSCLKSGTSCCSQVTTSSQNPIHLISVYSADGTPFTNDGSGVLPADAGLDFSGRPCQGFSKTAPNDHCPFQPQVYWNPISTNANCSAVQISLQLNYAGKAILNTVSASTSEVSPIFIRGSSSGTVAEYCNSVGGTFLVASNNCIMSGFSTSDIPPGGCPAGTYQSTGLNPKCISTNVCPAGDANHAGQFMVGVNPDGSPICASISGPSSSSVLVPTTCPRDAAANPTAAISGISLGSGIPGDCEPFPIPANPGCPAGWHNELGYCYSNIRSCTSAQLATATTGGCSAYSANWDGTGYNCSCAGCASGEALIGGSCCSPVAWSASGFPTGSAWSCSGNLVNPVCNGSCGFNGSSCVPAGCPGGYHNSDPDPCQCTIDGVDWSTSGGSGIGGG